MLATIRGKLAVGGVIAALGILILTGGSLFAQNVTPASGGMMDMASPTASNAPAYGAPNAMGKLMDQCQSMMDMMSSDGMMNMMNGNGMTNMMKGNDTMGGDGMMPGAGMEDPATPAASSDQ
jgi:hypothetical protein